MSSFTPVTRRGQRRKRPAANLVQDEQAQSTQPVHRTKRHKQGAKFHDLLDLPNETLQSIFIYSANLSLPLTCRLLHQILSGSDLIKQKLVTTVFSPCWEHRLACVETGLAVRDEWLKKDGVFDDMHNHPVRVWGLVGDRSNATPSQKELYTDTFDAVSANEACSFWERRIDPALQKTFLGRPWLSIDLLVQACRAWETCKQISNTVCSRQLSKNAIIVSQLNTTISKYTHQCSTSDKSSGRPLFGGLLRSYWESPWRRLIMPSSQLTDKYGFNPRSEVIFDNFYGNEGMGSVVDHRAIFPDNLFSLPLDVRKMRKFCWLRGSYRNRSRRTTLEQRPFATWEEVVLLILKLLQIGCCEDPTHEDLVNFMSYTIALPRFRLSQAYRAEAIINQELLTIINREATVLHKSANGNWSLDDVGSWLMQIGVVDKKSTWPP